MSFGPTVPRPNTFTINFPPYTTSSGPATPTIPTAVLTTSVPDNSLQFYAVAINLAGIASSIVAITTAMQTFMDPMGGLRVKDQLDPYQYQVVTQSLAATGTPSPGTPPVDVITPNPLGGAMAATGAVTGLAAAATALGSTAFIEKFLPGTLATGSAIAAGTGFPDYEGPLAIMNSALGVINTCASIMGTLITASVDVPSRALVLKSVMSAFGAALNTQSIAAAGRVPPTPPVSI